MLELPCGKKILGVIGGLPLVEINDPFNGIFVAIGLGDDRMRRKNKPVWLEHDMLGNVAGRFQIFVQQGRGHRE